MLVAEDSAMWFSGCSAELQPELVRHALRLTRHYQDAEDLVQDTMLKGYRSADSFTRGTNFGAWLHRILVNTYISGYRQRQRRPLELTAALTDQQQAGGSRHTSAGLPSAEEQALRSLPNEQIVAAMQMLNEQYRAAIYYADVEGYRMSEIAALTGAPLGTVASRLHRGRSQLRGLLADGDRPQTGLRR